MKNFGPILLFLLIAPAAGGIDIKQHPTRSEWQYFLRKGAELQKSIWLEQKSKGVNFAHWSWGWRILWLKSCGVSPASHCVDILVQGFDDPALVVRAETITQLGWRHQGSGDRKILAKLQGAFMEERNFRNHKPMFIHENILRAMEMIGGKRSQEIRAQLAKRYDVSVTPQGL